MAEYDLQADAVFGAQINQAHGELRLQSISGAGLWSLAFAHDQAEALKADLEQRWGVALPDMGSSAVINAAINKGQRCLGMQTDQFWLYAEDETDMLLPDVLEVPGVYLSEQSDSWGILRLSDQSAGAQVRSVLERMCPLDLHPDAFGVGKVARTAMAHLPVVMVYEAEAEYLLMTPRSSACSFYHEVQTSIRYVWGLTRGRL